MLLVSGIKDDWIVILVDHFCLIIVLVNYAVSKAKQLYDALTWKAWSFHRMIIYLKSKLIIY